LAYNSVYYLNDLKDYEEDKKEPHKRETKPLLNGSMTKKGMALTYLFYLISGLAISFYVSTAFGAIVALMLGLNALHSLVFKKIYVLLFANMIIIQSLKVTLGWLSATSSFEMFPFVFVLFLGSIYSVGYLVYKKEKGLIEVNPKKFGMRRLEYMRQGARKIFRALLGKPVNMFFLMLALSTLLISYYLYTFRLHIIFLAMSSLLVAMTMKYVKGKRLSLYTNYQIIIDLIYMAAILSFYLASTVPELVALNLLLL
jgi:4-hydroxybenzoate polyprenyltransferase